MMKKIFLVSAIALTLGACSARDDRLLTGAAIGGAAGAVVGGVATGTGGGALIGGAIGAAGGAVIADATRPRYHHRKRCHYSSRYDRTVCR
jgi:osmotically inducible lipoprotein OsmB